MSDSDVQRMKEQRDLRGLLAALRAWMKPARNKAAREALAEIGDAATVDALVGLLKDADHEVRRGAAQALGIIGDKRAVEPLIAAVRSDRMIRQTAAIALGALGDARAVDALLAALEDEKDDSYRGSIARALGNLGARQAVDALVAVIAQDKPGRPSSAAQGAAEALVKIADQKAVEPLMVLLKEGRFAAAKAVEGISPPTDPQTQAWCAVGTFSWERAAELGQAAVQPLVFGLQTFGSSADRTNAAEALGRIGSAEALDPLIAALQDRDLSVRAAAAGALAKLRDPKAVAPLTVALRDVDEWVRRAAATALGEIGDPRALEPLGIASSWDKDPLVRDYSRAAQKAIKEGPLAKQAIEQGMTAKKQVQNACGVCGKPREWHVCATCGGSGKAKAGLFGKRDCGQCGGTGRLLQCPDGHVPLVLQLPKVGRAC